MYKWTGNRGVKIVLIKQWEAGPTMRLIDVDELKRQVNGLPIMSNWGEAFIPQIIDEQPIIDPVHVAGGCYCRECEKAKPGGSGYVWCGEKAMPLNGFCSEGKRKDG